MGILFTNNAISSLQSAITATATTVVVSAADAAAFPQPVALTDYFMVTLEDKTQSPVLREICQCTARSGNQLTLVRGQENTTPGNFNAGVTVAHRLTAGSIQAISDGVQQPVTLYLGSFATAPTTGVGGVSLVAGNLYYDTTLSELCSYNGVAWRVVAEGAPSTSFGLYLGASANPPLTMLDGTALVVGAIYLNTASPETLYEWDGSAWDNVTNETTTATATNQTVTGNLVIEGSATAQNGLVVTNGETVDNLTVLDVTQTATLYLDGRLVVDAGDVSGGAFSQDFPSGTQEQWGTGATVTGRALVLFPTPFPTACTNVQVTLINPPVNCGAPVVTGYNAASFSVGVEDTDNKTGISTQFFWVAKGF